MKVLLVDDDSTDVDLYMKLFQELGIYDLTVTHTAEEARSWIKAHEPDLIIIDPHLPFGSGLTVLDQLAKLPMKPRVVINSHSDPESMIFSIKKMNTGLPVQVLPRKLSNIKECADVLKAPPKLTQGVI